METNCYPTFSRNYWRKAKIELRQYRRDFSDYSIHFQLLYFRPLEDLISFISCGWGSLLHLPQGTTTPRFLSNQNPPLGENSYHSFYETTENWKEGDFLVAHAFDRELSSDKKQSEDFELALKSIISNHQQLSAQTQAEEIINDLSNTLPSLIKSSPKSVITIQRII